MDAKTSEGKFDVDQNNYLPTSIFWLQRKK